MNRSFRLSVEELERRYAAGTVVGGFPEPEFLDPLGNLASVTPTTQLSVLPSDISTETEEETLLELLNRTGASGPESTCELVYFSNEDGTTSAGICVPGIVSASATHTVSENGDESYVVELDHLLEETLYATEEDLFGLTNAPMGPGFMTVVAEPDQIIPRGPTGAVANIAVAWQDVPDPAPVFPSTSITVSWGDTTSSFFLLPAYVPSGVLPVQHTYSGCPGQQYTGSATVAVLFGPPGSGHGDTDPFTVTIANTPPVAKIDSVSPSQPIFEGTPITVQGSYVDIDSACQAITTAWQVLKDGQPYTTGGGTSISFTPNDNGAYTAIFTVTDSAGASSKASASVEVLNVPPALMVNPPAALTCSNFTASISGTITDVSPVDTFRVVIDWGDGQTSVVPAAGQPPLGPGSAAFSANHTYVLGLNTLEYQVKVTATDDDGGAATQTRTLDGRAKLDPSLPDIDASAGAYDDLGTDPAGWNWDSSFPDDIEHAYIVPPLHDVPYVEGEDYEGNYGKHDVCLDFDSPGLYATKVVFRAQGAQALQRFIAIAAQLKDPGTARCIDTGRSAKIPDPAAFPKNAVLVQDDAVVKLDLPVYARLGMTPLVTNDIAAGIVYLQDISDEYQIPMVVDISAHGSRWGSVVALGPMQDANANALQFAAALNGRIELLELQVCCPAVGLGTNPNHLMRTLADGLSTLTMKTTVTGWNSMLWTVPASGRRPAYFATHSGATLYSVTGM